MPREQCWWWCSSSSSSRFGFLGKDFGNFYGIHYSGQLLSELRNASQTWLWLLILILLLLEVEDPPEEPGGGRAAGAAGVVDAGVLWNGHSWFGHKGGPKLSFFRWEQVQNYLSSDGNRSKSKSWMVMSLWFDPIYMVGDGLIKLIAHL